MCRIDGRCDVFGAELIEGVLMRCCINLVY